jgi:hypothetical protein
MLLWRVYLGLPASELSGAVAGLRLIGGVDGVLWSLQPSSPALLPHLICLFDILNGYIHARLLIPLCVAYNSRAGKWV